ncbi:MAG: hypothetical protein EOP42_11295 [Sphingobacteriaceae bacterium]|nr:MAG: hypothetical protein EOP42_11295 [Sphingobacteriaceae bacterium]
MVNFRFLWLILFVSAFFSCKQNPGKTKSGSVPETNEQLIQRTKTSFRSVLNIRFTEVYRRFDNGVSFNAQGYQLKPSWKFYFTADTTVQLYSDVKKRYFDMPVTLDHDSIFGLAGALFKARKISTDSLLFQVLSVKNRIINWKNSNVYVTFYAEDYLKKARLNVEKLQQTTQKDTAYIDSLAKLSATNDKKIFAAQQPVMLTSKSADVHVTNAKTKAKNLNSYYIPETLFYPEYQVTIHKAYADFYHSFAVKVDANGKLIFVEPMEAMIDDPESTIKIMKGIMDGYLTHYLQITPGKTLGIPHDSLILLVVRGTQN